MLAPLPIPVLIDEWLAWAAWKLFIDRVEVEASSDHAAHLIHC